MHGLSFLFLASTCSPARLTGLLGQGPAQPRVGALSLLRWEDGRLDDELPQWVKRRLHAHTQDLEWETSFRAPGESQGTWGPAKHVQL